MIEIYTRPARLVRGGKVVTLPALTELERAYEKLEDPEVAAHIIQVLWKLERQDDAMERLVDAEESWPESKLLENVRGLIGPQPYTVP